MAHSSTANVATANGSRYVQQLCRTRHGDLSEGFARADWPGDGVVTMIAHADHLECRIDASADGQLDGLKGALSRHLDRFAFREAPLRFDWHDQ